MMTCTLLFFTAAISAFFSIKKIIYVSHKKRLFDEPSENRKIHIANTPNLGGIGIFASMMLACAIFLPAASVPGLNYIVAGAVILFITGLTDDLVGMDHTKKIVAELVVALIITLPGGLRITGLYGIFGIHDLPYALSVILSILFILLLINAFNLIDGINCLAGSVGLLSCAVFAWGFWRMQETGYTFLALGMCGCLAAFLFYNRTPARIFMGDTGSLLLGFLVAILAISFMELNRPVVTRPSGPVFQSSPAVVLGLLIIPIFDTLRVFFLRVVKKVSPFRADRNHIHHWLIDLGLSHLQATGILLLVNIACLALVFFLRSLGMEIVIAVLAIFSVALNWLLGSMRTLRVGTANKRRQLMGTPEAAYSLGFADKEEASTRFAKMGQGKKEQAVWEA